MTRTDISRRTTGVNFNTAGQATVEVWAPFAKTAAIALQDNRTIIQLNKEDFGYWRTVTDELKPANLYKIIIDGRELPDPASLLQPEGVHGPSKAIDLTTFSWNDGEWDNLPLEDYIMYEVHTGTFTTEGTFAAIIEKLDHLLDLGVNAIEIMPVSQFPGGRNWGYDGVFPYAVHNSYGGAEGLQQLVQACHQKGLAVILDVVYNHIGPEGNYLPAFGPYFTGKYHTPWGDAINFDDAWCDGVRKFFIDNALMWFRDFRIDALRMDAVHAIKDFSPVHILKEIKQHVNLLMASTGKKYYLIAETDLNDNRFINPIEQNGFGLDAQWNDEFHHALRVAAGEQRSGYYADFTGLPHLAKSYKDAYVFDGIYSAHRRKIFGMKADNNPGRQFVVFSQNHDHIGNRVLGERTGSLVSFEMQKLMAAAVLASPYLPMLFMGEEYGEPNSFLYFVSHTDPELAEAVRKGRKAEFAAFHVQGEAPDPVDARTFNQSKLQWQLLQQPPHQTMFSFYKTLIKIRKQEPALRHLERHRLSAQEDEQKQTLVLMRWYEQEHIICLMNFSRERQQLVLPDFFNVWQKLLDSASPEWKGPQAAPGNLESGADVTIQPEAFLMYKCLKGSQAGEQ